MKVRALFEAKYISNKSFRDQIEVALKQLILYGKPSDLPSISNDHRDWFQVQDGGRKIWNWDNPEYPALLIAAKLLGIPVHNAYSDFTPVYDKLHEEDFDLHQLTQKVLRSPEIKQYKKNLKPSKAQLDTKIAEIERQLTSLRQQKAKLDRIRSEMYHEDLNEAQYNNSKYRPKTVGWVIDNFFEPSKDYNNYAGSYHYEVKKGFDVQINEKSIRSLMVRKTDSNKVSFVGRNTFDLLSKDAVIEGLTVYQTKRIV